MAKFVPIFNQFVLFDFDTINDYNQKVISKWKFWKARGISKQTIFDWENKVNDYLNGEEIYIGDTGKNIWKLTYAFYGALLCEATWEGACSFMTIAGHFAKNVPNNHEDAHMLVAACYRTLDYVYSVISEIETDDNDTRMMRLDLAEAYIKSHEQHLYIAIFAEE